MVLGLAALKIVLNAGFSGLVALLRLGTLILLSKYCLVSFLLAPSLPTVVPTLMMATSLRLILWREASSMYSWEMAPQTVRSLYSL